MSILSTRSLPDNNYNVPYYTVAFKSLLGTTRINKLPRSDAGHVRSLQWSTKNCRSGAQALSTIERSTQDWAQALGCYIGLQASASSQSPSKSMRGKYLTLFICLFVCFHVAEIRTVVTAFCLATLTARPCVPTNCV